MIQAVLDMSSVGLTSQAYTKVPNFAWVFGDTGIKINLSLIGKGTGLDANGNLVFDNREGMNFDEAMKLRERYGKNVGTILVGINDDHIIAAMGDPRIDFIIPFHKSGWSAEELRKMPTLNNYSDYTDTQNERLIIGRNADGSYETESFQKHKERTKEKLENFQPVGKNGYWNFNESGQWNAENYLKMCAEQKRIPKFSQFLIDNGDGSFSLPQGDDARSRAIREGYWKTLIDFKMYENDAYGRTKEDGTRTPVKGSKQTEVTPNVNMAQAYRVMNEYKLGRQMPDNPDGTPGRFIPMESNNSVPVAIPAAEEYIEMIRRKRAGLKPEGPSPDVLEADLPDDATSGNYIPWAANAFGASQAPAVLGNTESTAEESSTAQQSAMAIDAETGETVRYSLPDGTIETAVYVKDGKLDNGDAYDFVGKMLDREKKYETRDHNRLPRGWVGLSRGGKGPVVEGRVNLGNPIPFQRYEADGKTETQIYLDSKIKGTDFDMGPDDTKYAYPILDVEDFRDNPRPITTKGQYGKYRYSLPSDTDYMVAVDRGDMEEAQRLVKKKAAESGVYTNSRGTPINLFHGTKQNFGYTVFDTSRAKYGLGTIFTSSNRSVANGYSEFGYDRGASSKYIQDDGTDETIIRNAKNVLNSDVTRLTEEKAEEIHQREIQKYRELAEMETNAINESPDYVPPKSIDWDFWGVVQAFNDILNEDQFLYDEDLNFRKEYRDRDTTQRYIVDRNLLEARDNIKNYFNSNPEEMQRLKQDGRGYYNLLFGGYEHGDGIIDLEYLYKPLLNISDKFIYTGTDQITTREDLQRYIESEEQKGNYSLYGVPGDKPLEIDANNSFWTAIQAPIIGEGYYSTDEIVKWAKNNGYTSVVIRNVMDPGVVNAYGDDYIFFDSSQLKSADPVTYDDNGNVIPLSERFNTSEQDIRYSLPSDDVLDQQIQYHLEEMFNPAPEAEEDARYSMPSDTEATTPTGPQRQWGFDRAQNSDEIDEQVRKYLFDHSSYIPDTNAEQINRAIQWIRGNRTAADPDGYHNSVRKVTGKDFASQTPDGQAQMLATLAMAIAHNDVEAQKEIANAYNKEGTTAGQTLQARKIFRLMTPAGRVATLEKMIEDETARLGAKGITVDLKFSDWIYMMAAAANNEGDFTTVRDEAAKEIAEQLPANWKDRIRSIRMLSMLGNPRTHGRNFIGNALFIPAVSIKNKLGAVMELGMKQGNRTKTLAPVLPSDIRAFARQDAVTMKDELTGEAKYNESNAVKKAQKPFGHSALQWLIDKNSEALEAEDWFFLKGHYRRALGGWMVANGYTVEQVQNDAGLLNKGRAYAIDEAKKATYRDFSKVASILNDVSRKGGVAGFLVDAALPFKKTPANILKRGIEYSPIGIAKTLLVDSKHLKEYNDFQSGRLKVLPAKAISPNQFIDRICSGLSGSAVMAVGYILAHAGLLTVGQDDDDDKFDSLRGDQKYAIKLFGQDISFTLDWAAPMSMPFFVGAAVEKQISKGGDFDIEEMFDSMANISEPVFNLSMLDGVNTLFKTSQYDDTNSITQILAKVGMNYVSSYVPSVLGAAARTIDPYSRKSYVESGKGTGPLGTARYSLEQMQNKIPFYNQENIPVRDIWGNVEETPFMERLAENFILPGYIGHRKNDAVLDELERVYNATGDGSMIPSEPDKTITLGEKVTDNPRKIILTDKEWDAYKVARNGTAHDMLAELFENEYYLKADPDDQAKLVKDVWEYSTIIGKQAVAPDYKPQKNYGADPIATIVNDHKKSTKTAKTKNLNAEMLKALDANDFTAYETCVEALHENGVDDDTIKGKIGDTYRDQYKAAYLAGDGTQMYEIEAMLTKTGFKFDFDAWKKQAVKKNNQ
jgi:hypothetical protein